MNENVINNVLTACENEFDNWGYTINCAGDITGSFVNCHYWIDRLPAIVHALREAKVRRPDRIGTADWLIERAENVMHRYRRLFSHMEEEEETFFSLYERQMTQ